MEQQNLTIPVDPERSVVGYIINSELSTLLANEVYKIQMRLSERFPGAIWVAPRESLHITLMDWLAPLVDYDLDKDELFQSIKQEYSRVLEDILKNQNPINVLFDAIEVYPAAIIIKGHDDGSYQRIREQFLDNIDLIPGTKPPGQIVHSTICKFLQPISVDEIKSFIEDIHLAITEEVDEFRLVREDRILMQHHEVLGRFALTHDTK